MEASYRVSDLARTSGWLALCIAGVIGQADAHAECTAPTPACHLANGKALLDRDPRLAAEELLASFQLDERTDTLTLYAIALERDHRYALALDTWKRIITFRDSEVEAAREQQRKTSGKKRIAAVNAEAGAEKLSEEAAEAIIKLWPHVGKVRIRFAAGQQLAVSRDGAEVDATQDVIINAGGDELVFTRKDGSAVRVAVQVAPGATTKLDAPAPRLASARPADATPAAAKPAPAAPVAPPVPALAEDRDVAEVHVAPRPTPASPTDDRDDQGGMITLSRVGIGLVATGVLAGGVAGGFYYLSNRDFDRARTAGCSADAQCPIGPAADLAHQSNDRAHIAQYTAIGAGVLAATGLTLWYLDHRKHHRAVQELALHVGPSSTAVSGRF
ncbi:MAG TPA: hypothetical protein VGC42_31725 [Kofleriaceae bacterium]